MSRVGYSSNPSNTGNGDLLLAELLDIMQYIYRPRQRIKMVIVTRVLLRKTLFQIGWKYSTESQLIQNDKKCSKIGSWSTLRLLLLDDLPPLCQALFVSLTSSLLNLFDSKLVSLVSTMDDTVM